jgi:hypothetical protein
MASVEKVESTAASESRFVEVLLGLIGVWLVIRYVPDYVTVLYISLGGSTAEAGGPSILVLQSIRFGFSAVFGILAVVLRKRIAFWLQPSAAVTGLDARGILLAGCLLIGGYFILSGAQTIASYFAWASHWTQDTYRLWSGAISIVLGLALFLAIGWIARWWSYVYERT